ncbi:MAG: ribosome recycling factor [Candidatus Paceibacterota bacterium]
MNYDFSDFKKQLQDAEDWLSSEFKGIRTGRAAPAVLDSVKVEVYGSQMPINQVATVTTEDAKTIRIVPWDKSVSSAIESAIENANVGLSVNVDDQGLRVTFPELTSERREQLLKLSKQKLEEARVSVRTARDEVWDDIQNQQKDGDISEDDKYRLKEQMEDLVKKTNKGLEEMEERKKKEITE